MSVSQLIIPSWYNRYNLCLLSHHLLI